MRCEQKLNRDCQAAGFTNPHLVVTSPDPGLLDDVDERCVRVDRLLLQLADCLDKALPMLVAHPDRMARNNVATARSVVRELRDEFGEFGVTLLDLRDAINGEARP